MADQEFCLKWNNYQENLTKILDRLLQSEALVDVTLYVGGKCLKAHKTILSACSPYFEKMFMGVVHPHPVVVMKDFSYENIRGVLDFMYKGEVNVAQSNLGAFIKVAEMLEVRGLTADEKEKEESSPAPKRRRHRSVESDSSGRDDSNQGQGTSSVSEPVSRPVEQYSSVAPKRVSNKPYSPVPPQKSQSRKSAKIPTSPQVSPFVETSQTEIQPAPTGQQSISAYTSSQASSSPSVSYTKHSNVAHSNLSVPPPLIRQAAPYSDSPSSSDFSPYPGDAPTFETQPESKVPSSVSFEASQQQIDPHLAPSDEPIEELAAETKPIVPITTQNSTQRPLPAEESIPIKQEEYSDDDDEPEILETYPDMEFKDDGEQFLEQLDPTDPQMEGMGMPSDGMEGTSSDVYFPGTELQVQWKSYFIRDETSQQKRLRYICQLCGKSVYNPTDHLAAHFPGKHRCRICHKLFTLKGNLKKHIFLIHGITN